MKISPSIKEFVRQITPPFVNSFYQRLKYRNVEANPFLCAERNKGFLSSAYPGHFYSPIPDIDYVRKNRVELFETRTRSLPALELREDSQIFLIEKLQSLYAEMPFPDQPSSKCRYHLDNPFFSYGDGIMLHLLMRHCRPERVIEIGSGYSSAAMLDTNDMFLDRNVQFTFIEPYPDRLLKLVSDEDKSSIRIESRPVQEIDLAKFDCLQENDMLFIDSSHVAKIGSDVCHCVFNILPRLQQGVIVHFHDILWPFEYPESWLENGRAWNEAYFLRAFLQYNSAFEILYFNSFMAYRHAPILRECMPSILTIPSSPVTFGNSSLWLKKVA